MKDKRSIHTPASGNTVSRRRFMKDASLTAAAGAVALSGFGCKGGMKYNSLGRSGIKASIFFGDQMADAKMYEMAIGAGVNYWHKIGGWKEPAPYELFRKLDRDSWYCDTTVGSLDKDEAIEIFERKRKTTGLEMIDGFKVHSRYRYPEEIKEKTGVIQAFETLKKQGKTRVLMMSQHVNTSEVLEAAIESDFFDVIQVPINPTVPKDYFTKDEYKQKTQDEYLGLFKKAASKDIGITAMKVFMYGPKNWEQVPDLKERVKDYLPDNQSIATALIHWTLSVPGVKAFGNLLYTFEELRENLGAVGGELTAREDEGLKRITQVCGGYFCRLCGKCESANPDGVAVSSILRYSMYSNEHRGPAMAKALYRALPKKARVEAASDLKRYEKACPYGLPVARLLEEAQARLA